MPITLYIRTQSKAFKILEGGKGDPGTHPAKLMLKNKGPESFVTEQEFSEYFSSDIFPRN